MTPQRLGRVLSARFAAVLALLAVALPAGAQNQPHKTVLRNGLVVITKEVHDSPVLAVNLFVRGGASQDPSALPGVANFTQRMLLKGTTRRSEAQLTEPIEAIGGTLQARADYDYSQLLLLCGAEALDTGLDLLADAVRHPSFPQEAMERERQQILAALTGLDSEPNWVVQRSLSQLLYASGPYARMVPGTQEAVRRITRQNLLDYYRRVYTPENLIVVVVGNIDRAAAEEKIERLFGDMPASGRPPLAAPTAQFKPLSDQDNHVVLKERNTELAHMALGFPMAGISREEYPTLLVMSSLLGGGMGSLLMREVRERQGLGYELGSSYSQYEGPSYFIAYIRTAPTRMVFGLDGPYPSPEAVLNKAKNAILGQIEAVRDNPVSDVDLARARRYAIGTLLYDHQRTLRQAQYLGWFELVGLGYQYDEELPDALAKVSKEDVAKLARKYFTRYAVSLVMPEPAN